MRAKETFSPVACLQLTWYAWLPFKERTRALFEASLWQFIFGFVCNFIPWKDLYTAFNVSKWCLLFQNEKLLNSISQQITRARAQMVRHWWKGRVLKMAAYDSSSGFVVFINVKDSLKDVARSTKWNRIQHHQMWTFHPRQSHWWAKTMSISFDLYWFRLEQRRECIVLSVSLLDSYQLKCYRRFILTKLN